MLARRSFVALVDHAAPEGARVVVDGDGVLPSLGEGWFEHRDFVRLVGDPGAVVVAPPVRETDGVVVHVLAWSGGPIAAGLRWVTVDDVAEPSTGAATVRQRAAELRAGVVPDDGREPWFAPGWLDEVDAWVGSVLGGTGLGRDGERELVKVWGLSAVLRYPVRDGDGATRDLWFKAVCDGFRAEPALTAWVAELDATVAPTIVALDLERAWMLLEPFAETDEPGLDQIVALAASVARLQLASVPYVAALLAAGAPERGLDATIAGLAEVVHDGVERPATTPEQREAAFAAEPVLVEAVTALHRTELPMTLVHGDLHLGNATWRADGTPLLFDWTDACAAHPFLDGRHLAASVAHHVGADGEAAVREGYLGVWRAAYPQVDVDRAWELAEVGDRVFTLVSYEGIYRAQRPEDRWELGGIGIELMDKLVSLVTED